MMAENSSIPELDEVDDLITRHFGLNLQLGPSTEYEETASDNELETIDFNADAAVGLYLRTPLENDQNDQEDTSFARIQFTLETGCFIGRECLRNLTSEEVYENILNVKEMTNKDKDILIMSKMLPAGNSSSDTRYGKRKRVKYHFRYKERTVCRDCFKFLYGIGEKYLRNLKEHLDKNGCVPRCHGNEGKIPSHALKYEDVLRIVSFLVNYADENGLPQPVALRRNDVSPPVFLPCTDSKAGIHRLYESMCEEEGVRVMKLTSFKDIWSRCCPHIRIASPKEDVCHRCEKFRDSLKYATTEEDKIEFSRQLISHIEECKAERENYKTWIQDSKDELHQVIRPDGPIPALSNNYLKIHYTFDFSQNVTVPHHSRQVGALYFSTPRKVQLFGVRIDAVPVQFNYIIDEDETIGEDGTKTHGPDSVISMLHHCLETHGYGEQKCGIHADNCAGQNKNGYVLAYFCWRIMVGLHREINYMMQIPGHTRCIIDSGFAHIKRLYKKTDVDCLANVAEVVEKSAHSNRAVLYKCASGTTWRWREWKTFLSALFRPVKGITKYQHFRFSADKPGSVFVKERIGSMEKEIVLLKNFNNRVLDPAALPNAIVPPGLSLRRQQYLYNTIRRHVRAPFQDITCPVPTEE